MELSIQDLEARVAALEAQLAARDAVADGPSVSDHHLSLVVFSGEMDKLMAAFTIATGAAAMGVHVHMFFTFWGLNALRVKTSLSNKGISEKMLAAMLPQRPDKAGISSLNMGGVGGYFMRHVMKAKGVAPLPELIDTASELGVELSACSMSMEIMGITTEEMRQDVQLAGVATFLGDAFRSRSSLFI